MTQREELIKEIERISPRDCNNSEGLADFILNDRKRIVEPLLVADRAIYFRIRLSVEEELNIIHEAKRKSFKLAGVIQ